MGIDEYFYDIFKSHCNKQLHGKLADYGYFQFWKNRISNHQKDYSISQVYINNLSTERHISINFSAYVNDKWVDEVGVVRIYKDQIDFIVDEGNNKKNVIINSKEDVFNLSLMYGMRVSLETIVKLQSLVPELENSGINSLVIYYGTGEEKEYGY